MSVVGIRLSTGEDQQSEGFKPSCGRPVCVAEIIRLRLRGDGADVHDGLVPLLSTPGQAGERANFSLVLSRQFFDELLGCLVSGDCVTSALVVLGGISLTNGRALFWFSHLLVFGAETSLNSRRFV